MDFARLSAGAGTDPAVARQLAQQLLANSLFRDAAIKATQKPEEEAPSTGSSNEATSGLDNLLNQLTSALTQASSGEAPAEGENGAVTNLLQHPFLQQALGSLSLEDSLGLKVLLGQVDADTATRAVELLDSIPPSTMQKVETVLKNLSSAELQKGVSFFQALFGDRGDMGFAQQNNFDAALNSTNSQAMSGADLNKFLQTAYYVLSSGYDVGKFFENATKAAQKGDYDDFRRFLDVTDLVMYKGENLDSFFDYSNKTLDEAPKDYESNLFQMYMTMGYGGRMQDYVDIAENLDTIGMDGRNNLVDFTRIVVDFYKQGGYTPALFDAMALEAREGGDVRAFMDDYMAARGLADKSPDFSRFARIERIDGDPMVITQGESAALFAQAVSTQQGLLPESVIAWSSKQTGPMTTGSSYLDLSKLPPGTYQIAAKIVGMSSTDTGMKTVIVLPADGSEVPTTPATPEIVLPTGGQIRVTVQPGSASLRSDLFIKQNGLTPDLVAANAQQGAGVTLQRNFSAGDKLDFFIRTFHPNGAYDHGTDVGSYNGQAYVQVTQTGPNTWVLSFEDLEGDAADWDYNDVVVQIELLPNEATAPSGDDGGVIIGGGGATPPSVQALTGAEAADVTRTALNALNGGASAADVANSLSERYYAALDGQIAANQAYADKVSDVRNDAAELRALLRQILQALTGEEIADESAETPPVGTQPTGQTPSTPAEPTPPAGTAPTTPPTTPDAGQTGPENPATTPPATGNPQTPTPPAPGNGGNGNYFYNPYF
ncbi:MAG: hypothetical protein ACO1RX_09550 [Candidatus Sericytochromatia bacterium]